MKIDTSVGSINLDYDPANYNTAAGAAKGLYKAIQKFQRATGGDPEAVWIKNPQESEDHGYVGKAWWVVWEEGPYQWACGAFASGPWGHAEPYWGFDLAFYN